MDYEINTKSCWKKCGITTLIVIIIIIIIAALIIYLLYNRFKNNFLKNYKIGTVQYCNNLPNVNYTFAIHNPKTPGIYEYK